MLKKYLKTPRKDSRRRFERVLKMYMKREVSWDRFFIDFDTILESPGEVKMWFSLRRGSNFEVFASSNISYLLESKKHRFWKVFGGQDGYRKCVRWLQEASWGEVTNFLGVPKVSSKMSRRKSAKKTKQQKKEISGNRGGGPLNQINPLDLQDQHKCIRSLHFVPSGARWRIFLVR